MIIGWMNEAHCVRFDQKTELKAEIVLRHMVLLDLKLIPKRFFFFSDK